MSHKLSLGAAILISSNIMLGSGIFINTVLLSRQSGCLSAGVYGLVALLILPLILAIAQLLHMHNEGGTFYHFGKSVHPYVGFLSSWSYFIAKMATCALGVHVCISLLQEVIPLLQTIPTLVIDTLVLIFFGWLNQLHLRMGSSIQLGFMGLKLVPIFFVIGVGLYAFNPGTYVAAHALWSGVPLSIPLVLYAFSGFEATCSLSRSIENPEKNGPLALFISYAIVVSLVMLYQGLFYGVLGTALASLFDYKGAFPLLLQSLFPESVSAQHILTSILHIGIAASSLGASYGIMYSNSWNLYTLAQHGHVFLSEKISTLNKHAIPVLCIVIEVALAVIYLWLTRGHQIPLQQVSALGSGIAYTISAFSLFWLTYTKTGRPALISVLALLSCTILLGSLAISIATNGVSLLLGLFITILAVGSYIFFTVSTKE